MLLAGFAISSLLAATMTLLMSINERLQIQLRDVFKFLMGSVSNVNWEKLAVVAPLVIIGVLIAQMLARHLNAFSLGEEGAGHLGINTEKEKLIFLSLGSLLTATAVSISGLVGFVGLITPHALRLVLGPDNRLLLPASALAGGIFLRRSIRFEQP
jgi:iron complex transport system permease protein